MNRKIEYALIALKYMSQKAPGQLTSAKEITERFQLPFDPTARVLQVMTQNGVLRAEQGVYGGYQILKDLSRISLGDLSDMITGPIQITTCVHGMTDGSCGLMPVCEMIQPMTKLNGKVQELFQTIKLDDFLEIGRARNPVPAKP